jgi:hypothetical protein
MIYIVLDNVTNLNDSLQVGDMIYATTPVDSGDLQTSQDPVGAAKIVGILREISESAASGNIMLIVDETPFTSFYAPTSSDFVMFSKYSQSDGEISGYYARAKFVNDSKDKAELFAVSSEIICLMVS